MSAWKECAECRSIMPVPWVHCPFCGTVSDEIYESERCTHCGYYICNEWWHCPGCGEDWQVFSGSDPNYTDDCDDYEDIEEGELVVTGHLDDTQ